MKLQSVDLGQEHMLHVLPKEVLSLRSEAPRAQRVHLQGGERGAGVEGMNLLQTPRVAMEDQSLRQNEHMNRPRREERDIPGHGTSPQCAPEHCR